jgi:hypothetical protein
MYLLHSGFPFRLEGADTFQILFQFSSRLPQVHCLLGVEPEFGAVPNSRESLSAMAGLRARLSRKSSLTVWRETPSAPASVETDNP